MQWYHDEKIDAIIRPVEGEYLKTRYYLQEGNPTVITVGMGESEKYSVLRCKEIYASGMKTAIELEAEDCMFELDHAVSLGNKGVFAAVEGIYGVSYQQKFALKEQTKPSGNWYVSVSKNSKNEYKYMGMLGEETKGDGDVCLDTCLKEADALAHAVIWVRNLVNMPGNQMTPEILTDYIAKKMHGLPIEIEVLEEEDLKKFNMNAILTVGESSEHTARLVVLRYTGEPKEYERLGYVGKGITCDSGGYCLKPAASMAGIKGDMAGGAAVAAAVWTLAYNQVPVNVTAVIPICENRISRGSALPGDVITGMSGKTIEILNTDAEGRLILSDAITWAIQKEGVTKLVDIATLTGAVVQMFGFVTAGVMCSDDEWFQALQAAAAASGEKYWRLPMDEEYETLIDSDYADVRNTSRDGCGTVTAGLFLHRFAENLPWMHLDIAGTASVNTPVWKFQTSGATGAGTTTLYYLAAQSASAKKEEIE